MDRAEEREHRPTGLETLKFQGCSAPVLFDGCEPLQAALLSCIDGWQLARQAAGTNTPLAVVSAADAGRAYVASRYTDRPTGALPMASAACSLIADLSLDWCQTQPDIIGLHAGAVEINGRLVVVIGPARAGKSTFTAELASRAGCRFFCDDVLPIDESGMAYALGIAPRLRLPLPAGAQALSAMLAHATILRDDRYAYVKPAERAPFGTRAPIAAIVLLDRRESGDAQLFAFEPGEAAAALLQQSLTSFENAETALSQISALAERTPLARLVYAELPAGADLLISAARADFAWQDLPQAATAAAAQTTLSAPPISPDSRIARDPDVRLRQVGARSWVFKPADPTLWELNQTSLAIWHMLEEPGSAHELAEILAEMMPNQCPSQLRRDIATLLTELVSAGLAAVEARDMAG